MDHALLKKETKTLPYHISKEGKKVWTDEGIAEVAMKYKNGSSNGVLAAEYKTTVGSIAGLINRARKKNLLPPSKINRKPKLVVVKKRPTPVMVQRINKVRYTMPIHPTTTKKVRLKIIDSPTAVTLEELRDHHCKYPIGDPKQSDFRYCGKARIEPAPYCQEHCSLSYVKSYRS